MLRISNKRAGHPISPLIEGYAMDAYSYREIASISASIWEPLEEWFRDRGYDARRQSLT